jgi:hypothetical protein
VSFPALHDARRAERIDLVADLNAQDDDGYGWSVLSDARDPSAVTVGALLVAGNSQAVAVVRVRAVDDDGQVHFKILPASISKNCHLLDHRRAQESPPGR